MSTNYQKWDKFADNIMDSSDDEDLRSRNVQVTKFDQASSIKIGPQGSEVLKSTEAIEKAKQHSKHESGIATTDSAVSISNTMKEVTKNCTQSTNLMQNGGFTGSFYWSQSRDEVIIRKPLSVDVKAGDVIVAYQDDPTMRFDGIRPELKFTTKGGDDILSGRLQFDIIPNDSADSEVLSRVDWELKNLPIESLGSERVLEITLQKKSLIPGAIFWWRNVFVGDPEIDLNEINGRNSSTRIDADVWDEAHRKFKEKLQENAIVPIDVDSCDDAESDNL